MDRARKVRRLHGRLRYRLGLLGDRVATGFTLGLSGSRQPNPTPGLALELLVRLQAYSNTSVEIRKGSPWG